MAMFTVLQLTEITHRIDEFYVSGFDEYGREIAQCKYFSLNGNAFLAAMETLEVMAEHSPEFKINRLRVNNHTGTTVLDIALPMDKRKEKGKGGKGNV